MTTEPAFTPPPNARAYPLRTARGTFAVVDHPVAPGVRPRGVALLLPGFTGSKEDFTLMHEPLAARGYRTIAVDGRGQHESDGPEHDESAYAQSELARDVLAQVAALGPLDTPCTSSATPWAARSPARPSSSTTRPSVR